MERYIKSLMGFVRNKTRPEGGTAEVYALKEALGFCIKYMQEFASTRRRVWNSYEEPRMTEEVPEGKGKLRRFSARLRGWAHNYVVNNATSAQAWRE